MKKRIDILIERYFSGETSLQEEQELKSYFASEDIADEHIPYASLFQNFDAEKEQRFVPAFSSHKKKRKLVHLTWISGVAASIVLALLLIPRQPQDTYLVVNGQKIYDTEMAISRAEQKLNAITSKISSSLEPIERTDRNLERALQPVRAAEESVLQQTNDYQH